MNLQRQFSGHLVRRIMINYRVELSVIRERLPTPFQPRVIGGYGVAGLDWCWLVPKSRWRRKASLMLCHRIEAMVPHDNRQRVGAYVLRCDVAPTIGSTSLRTIFPAVTHRTPLSWEVTEDGVHHLRMGRRQHPQIQIRAQESHRFPFDTIMSELDLASAFFERGKAWFAPKYGRTLFAQRNWVFDQWHVHPLRIDRLEAPYFRRVMRLPKRACFFDHALLMSASDYSLIPAGEFITPRPMRTHSSN